MNRDIRDIECEDLCAVICISRVGSFGDYFSNFSSVRSFPSNTGSSFAVMPKSIVKPAKTDEVDQKITVVEADYIPTQDELDTLFSAGFDVVDVPADGDCLFSSVAVAMHIDPSNNYALRQGLKHYAETHSQLSEIIQPNQIKYMGTCTPMSESSDNSGCLERFGSWRDNANDTCQIEKYRFGSLYSRG